jgi:hypothetical protein
LSLQHLFSKLPAELRLKIWRHCIPGARLIPITCGASPSDDDDALRSRLATGCVSRARLPAILHACSESRAVILRHHRLLFGFARGPGQVLADPAGDMLFFGQRSGFAAPFAQFVSFLSLCDPGELARVRRVAVSDHLFCQGSGAYRSETAGARTVELLLRLGERMPGLSEVVWRPWKTMMRLEAQICTSVKAVMKQHPEWELPPWRILPMQALANAVDCTGCCS